MVLVFLFLTSLSMIITRSIHVAANGIISFFVMVENIPNFKKACKLLYLGSKIFGGKQASYTTRKLLNYY